MLRVYIVVAALLTLCGVGLGRSLQRLSDLGVGRPTKSSAKGTATSNTTIWASRSGRPTETASGPFCCTGGSRG